MKEFTLKNVTSLERAKFINLFTQEFQEFNFENLLISENTKLKGRFLDYMLSTFDVETVGLRGIDL